MASSAASGGIGAQADAMANPDDPYAAQKGFALGALGPPLAARGIRAIAKRAGAVDGARGALSTFGVGRRRRRPRRGGRPGPSSGRDAADGSADQRRAHRPQRRRQIQKQADARRRRPRCPTARCRRQTRRQTGGTTPRTGATTWACSRRLSTAMVQAAGAAGRGARRGVSRSDQTGRVARPARGPAADRRRGPQGDPWRGRIVVADRARAGAEGDRGGLGLPPVARCPRAGGRPPVRRGRG